MQGAQVWSLVRELWSHKLHGTAKKEAQYDLLDSYCWVRVKHNKQMNLWLEKWPLRGLQRKYKRTEDGHVTLNRMEESQGGFPGGDAAYLAYYCKSTVLGIQWMESHAQRHSDRETLACSKHAGSPGNHAWKQLDLQICSSGPAEGTDLRGIHRQISSLGNVIPGLSHQEILTKVPCFPRECRCWHQDGVG